MNARSFLRQLAAGLTHSGPGYEPAFRPARGDAVEAWLKAERDAAREAWTFDRYSAYDDLLDDYRLHADTGTPLGQHACGGPHCDCDEVTA